MRKKGDILEKLRLGIAPNPYFPKTEDGNALIPLHLKMPLDVMREGVHFGISGLLDVY